MSAVSAQQANPLVAVIATGGTIASQRGDSGASTPTLSGEALLSFLPDARVDLRPVELMAKDSSSLTFADMQTISDEVGRQLADPAVGGVVILHGTDTMEETALLVHLQHSDSKPVIFTGAQFTADHPQSDGPENLSGAIKLASGLENNRKGVFLHFGGKTLPAWGLYKYSSDLPDAFANAREIECPCGLRFPGDISNIRVDTVSIYPGCDATHIDASLAAGAAGIVLAGLGSGNANPLVVEAVRRCTEKGVSVVVSSRVPSGMLVAGYGGGGGGFDLAEAGAVHSRTLRPGQARVLLAALLATGAACDVVKQAFDDGGYSA